MRDFQFCLSEIVLYFLIKFFLIFVFKCSLTQHLFQDELTALGGKSAVNCLQLRQITIKGSGFIKTKIIRSHLICTYSDNHYKLKNQYVSGIRKNAQISSESQE